MQCIYYVYTLSPPLETHNGVPVKNAWKMDNQAKGKDYVIYAKSPEVKMKWMEAFRKEKERVAQDKDSGSQPHPFWSIKYVIHVVPSYATSIYIVDRSIHVRGDMYMYTVYVTGCHAGLLYVAIMVHVCVLD